MQLDLALVRDCVRRALAEDLGAEGDLTARLCVPRGRRAAARVIARQSGVLAGLPVFDECLRQVDAAVVVEHRAEEGCALHVDQIVVVAHGEAHALLAAERTALNFLQRLCGIASAARAFAQAAASLPLRVFDTRKTTPGLRFLEKYAVRVGGGHNHRLGLYDQALIKENHFALALPRGYADVVRDAVRGSSAPVIAEARNQGEAVAAVEGGASVILLDNFAPGAELRAAVLAVRAAAARVGRSVEVEASGGVTLRNVRAFAECGVDRVSAGSLTHSVVALDLSMLIEAEP